jgi:hypothetical protein
MNTACSRLLTEDQSGMPLPESREAPPGILTNTNACSSLRSWERGSIAKPGASRRSIG